MLCIERGDILERARDALEKYSRGYTAMKEERNEAREDLRSLRIEHQGLRNGRQELGNEHHNLLNYVDYLEFQAASAMPALEKSNSARRAAESDAANYKDLYLKATAACRDAQRIAAEKEKVIAYMNEGAGAFSSLQYRLDGARNGKEMEKELSVVKAFTMELLISRERDSVSAAPYRRVAPPAERLHRNTESQREGKPRVTTSRALTVQGDRVSEARASAARLGFNVRKLQAQLLEFKQQEKMRARNDGGARRRSGG